MELTKKELKRRINRINKKVDLLKSEHGDTPSLTHSYHGGWSLGYWQGKLSYLEEALDELEETSIQQSIVS